MQVKAILFDTRSIQRYIFSGNKLKTNIGASFIVEHLFERVLLGEVLQAGAFGLTTVDTESWKKGEASAVLTELSADAYVAYIGGGNALVLFRNVEEDVLKQIVAAFTKRLLVEYPGLRTGAAIGELTLDETGDGSAFKASLDALYGKLKQNQNTIFPQVNVPYTGLTLACEVNGEAANFFDEHVELHKNSTMRFISQEVAAKLAAAPEANQALTKQFEAELQGYRFPEELAKLGQKDGEDYLAIVHVDGNNMGVKFNNCKNLAERSALSKTVKRKTQAAFAKLVASAVAEYDTYAFYLNTKRTIPNLPLRPLILGGDDVTFVCAARVALTYTQRFMQYMLDEKVGDAETKQEWKKIPCCAGIAILPSAYPFFRGYELAEQLCAAAKARSRKIADSSWLDFGILHGEQAPTLQQIREQEYQGARGNMHFGPYRVDGGVDYHFAFSKFLQLVDALRKLPRNKVKEMRSVAQHGEHDARKFVEQLVHNGNLLPAIEGWTQYNETLWSQHEKEMLTPYVDAVEMMDFTPIRKGEE